MRILFHLTVTLTIGAFVTFLGLANPVQAQTTEVPFGMAGHDTSQPIQIVSDSFVVSQKTGAAEFLGNVVVSQGEFRMTADKITAVYVMENGKQTGTIDKVIANGNIVLSRPPEAAEADSAIYTIADSTVLMEGNVMLTQDKNMIVGQKILINLIAGSATIEGRVKTVFQSGGSGE
jgi:lipopolysaccharide export system protein LptA